MNDSCKILDEAYVKGSILQLREENNEREFYFNGIHVDRFKMLAMAERTDDKETAWDILNIASILYHPRQDTTFNTLYGIVAMHIAQKYHEDEFTYQNLFKNNCEKCGFGRIANHKNDGRNIPDAWVEKDGELIPVEVKFSDFNKKALKQLQRYMDAYKTNHGYAVARNLTVDLPDSVTFIPFSAFDESSKEV